MGSQASKRHRTASRFGSADHSDGALYFEVRSVAKANNSATSRTSGVTEAEVVSTTTTEQAVAHKPVLRAEDVAALTESWAMASDKMSELGYQTFVGLFRDHPQTKTSFGDLFGEYTDINTEYSALLKQHSARVIALVRAIIAHLDADSDDQSAAFDEIRAVGRRHFDYNVLPMHFELMGPHFAVSLLQIFDEELTDGRITQEWLHVTSEAYLNLFEQISLVMKDGWNDKREESVSDAKANLNKGPNKIGTTKKGLKQRRNQLRNQFLDNQRAYKDIFDRNATRLDEEE